MDPHIYVESAVNYTKSPGPKVAIIIIIIITIPTDNTEKIQYYRLHHKNNGARVIHTMDVNSCTILLLVEFEIGFVSKEFSTLYAFKSTILSQVSNSSCSESESPVTVAVLTVDWILIWSSLAWSVCSCWNEQHLLEHLFLNWTFHMDILYCC